MEKHKISGRKPPHQPNSGKPWLGKTPGVSKADRDNKEKMTVNIDEAIKARRDAQS